MNLSGRGKPLPFSSTYFGQTLPKAAHFSANQATQNRAAFFLQKMFKNNPLYSKNARHQCKLCADFEQARTLGGFRSKSSKTEHAALGYILRLYSSIQDKAKYLQRFSLLHCSVLCRNNDRRTNLADLGALTRPLAAMTIPRPIK